MSALATLLPQCCFFQQRTWKYQIICEGIVEHSTLRTAFERHEDYDMHYRTFCCNHYANCEIYRMLMELYGD